MMPERDATLDRMSAKLLTARETAKVLAISKRQLWRLVATGVLPKPVRLARRTTRWRLADIENFVRAAK